MAPFTSAKKWSGMSFEGQGHWVLGAPDEMCIRDRMTIEATGSPDKLDALLEMLKPYGVRELVQSGLVALGRGSRSLSDRAKIDKTRPAVRLAN